MFAVFVNAGAIIACGLIGRFLFRSLFERFREPIHKIIGLFVLFLGMKGAFESEQILIMLFSLLFGGIIGEALDIEGAMFRLGVKLERLPFLKGGNAGEGFVTASILFCTGSMAIIGAIHSGLSADYELLFVKTVMDGFTAAILAASMGLGVIVAAVPVFIYEGAIALGAEFLGKYLSEAMITEMSAVGNLTIIAIGLNFLIPGKPIKAANLVPGIFMPIAIFAILGAFGWG